MNNEEKLDYINEVKGAWCIGNGQLHDALIPDFECSKTLNCMSDPMKILVIKDE